jgi:hypothetical protein
MSRKGTPNLKGKQEYPRKCDYCDYTSNNPSMYYYHKQTHDPIPDEQKCDHGCGQRAMFKGTGGKYTCVKNAHCCPEYLRLHAERVREQWTDSSSVQRKENTKQSLIKRLHNKETIAKMSKTKREKFGTLDPVKAKEYRHYARFIRQRAQIWAKDQGYTLGRQTSHVDHKLSILDAWHAGLSESVVNHPANLQIIEAKQNSSKGAKSTITVEELLRLIS